MAFLGAWKLVEEPRKWQKEATKNVAWETSKREVRKKNAVWKMFSLLIIL